MLDLLNANGISEPIYTNVALLQEYFVTDNYEILTINGAGGITGQGRVTSISFEGGDDVNDKVYNADFEIYSDGDLDIPTGSGEGSGENGVDAKYAGIKTSISTAFDSVENISESFTYEKDQNGSFSYSHSVQITCIKAPNVITLAKKIANDLKTNNSIEGFLGEYGQKVKKLYEEKADKINGSYSFTENGFYEGSLNSELNFFSKVSRSFSIDEQGDISVSEDGEVVGFGADKFAKAKAGYATILSASRAACMAIFNSYSTGGESDFILKDDIHVSKSKNEDVAGGKISYKLEYSNKQSIYEKYTHEYTTTKTKRGRFYDISQSGRIKGNGPPSVRLANALENFQTIITQAKTDLGSLIDKAYMVSESISQNEFDGIISYSIKKTNDPDFDHKQETKITKVSSIISELKPLPIKNTFGIIGAREFIQTLKIKSILSRQITIQIMAKKDADYERDILKKAVEILEKNKPKEKGYIDSCDIQYNPISKNFTLKLVWNLENNLETED